MPNCNRKKSLQVHHIRKWASASTLRFEIDNGITLCYGCHKEVTNNETFCESLFHQIVREKMPKIQPFKIIKDTREQEGYTFEPSSSRYHKCEGMVVRKLDTGDYSLEGLEDKVCIERKASVVEFANNIGHDAVRFAKEIER